MRKLEITHGQREKRKCYHNKNGELSEFNGVFADLSGSAYRTNKRRILRRREL